MGKSHKEKHRVKELATRKKQFRADDYYRHGPLEIARFGRYVTMRNNMSPGEFQEMQKDLAKRYPDVCQEIDNLITQIVAIVAKLPPSELLKRAYWEMASHHLNMESESDVDSDAVLSLRMVDYLQSLIVSATPPEKVLDNISEDVWAELKKMVGSLFSKLSIDYQICRTALNRTNDPDFDLDYEEFYYEAQQYWVNLRGQRYLVHDIPALSNLLTPHNEVFKELFGINTDELITGFRMIQDSLTLGIGKVMNDLEDLRKAIIEKAPQQIKDVDKITTADVAGELISRMIEANNWQDWREDIMGRLLGLDLFDLDKITKLPKPLLDELSWEPGQDSEFLEEGQFRGWPLRIWPVFKRPFIKLDGRHYCFDLYSLFDHLYRVIERTVIRLKPQYREEWNRKQKELSERLPFGLFTRLLPGARVYRQVYYRTGNGQWYESDGLLVWEDHLFIIEIRAGAFTYTSPATDFPAYVTSIKNLLLKPVEQGRRFLKYLNTENEVAIFDEYHRQIGKISKNDFEHVTICAISLDEFTELAARAQHLKKIGVDVGEKPVWAISLDNLRQYADIFNNPLSFLNFVEERMRASQSNIVEVKDELDHLGLYLKHNSYTRYAHELTSDEKTKLGWYGYRSDIDKFFAEKFHNPQTGRVLEQNMPERLREIIEFLSVNFVPHRRKVASTLLDCGDKVRGTVTASIDEVLARQSQTRRPIPLSTYGEVKVTLFCWQIGLFQRNYELAEMHTKTAMIVAGDSERLLLELTYNVHGVLTDVFPSFITLAGISAEELEKIKVEAAKLRKTRIRNAVSQRGKIGRNELCPCGSGKKYKRCCIVMY